MVKITLARDWDNAVTLGKAVLTTGIVTTVPAASYILLEPTDHGGADHGLPAKVLLADFEHSKLFNYMGNDKYGEIVVELSASDVEQFFNASDWTIAKNYNFSLMPKVNGSWEIEAFDKETKQVLKHSKVLTIDDVHGIWEKNGYDLVVEYRDMISEVNATAKKTVSEQIPGVLIDDLLDVINENNYSIGQAAFTEGKWTYTADAETEQHVMDIDLDEKEVGMHGSALIGNYNVLFDGMTAAKDAYVFKITEKNTETAPQIVELKPGEVKLVNGMPLYLKDVENNKANLSAHFELKENFSVMNDGPVSKAFSQLDGSKESDGSHALYMSNIATHNTVAFYEGKITNMKNEISTLNGLIKDLYQPGWAKANGTIATLNDTIHNFYQVGWDKTNRTITDFYIPMWKAANDTITNLSKEITDLYKPGWKGANDTVKKKAAEIAMIQHDFNNTVEELDKVFALSFTIDNKYIFRSVIEDSRLTPAEREELMNATERQEYFDGNLSNGEFNAAMFTLGVERAGNATAKLNASKNYAIEGRPNEANGLLPPTLLKVYALTLEHKAIYDNTTFQDVEWDWATFKYVYDNLSKSDPDSANKIMDRQMADEFSDGNLSNGEGMYIKTSIPDKDVYVNFEVVYSSPNGERTYNVMLDKSLVVRMKEIAEG